MGEPVDTVVGTIIAVLAALGRYCLLGPCDWVIDFTVMEAGVSATALEMAIIFVREEEQSRIMKLCHNKVLPHVIAAMFEAQSVKEELESRGNQEDEALSRMIERLVQAVYGIEFIVDLEEMPADPSIAALLQHQISLQKLGAQREIDDRTYVRPGSALA
jgi:hypothetical protein